MIRIYVNIDTFIDTHNHSCVTLMFFNIVYSNGFDQIGAIGITVRIVATSRLKIVAKVSGYFIEIAPAHLTSSSSNAFINANIRRMH